MRPKKLSYTIAALSAAGYASNVKGATFTLTATTPGDGLAHPVTIHNDSGTDLTGIHCLLTGTDAEGRVQTETIHLPNTHGGGSDTVTSTKYFKTLVSAVPDATTGNDTLDIGWTAVSYTPAYPVAVYPHDGPLVGVDVGATTVNYTVQQTNEQIFTDTPVTFWTTLQAAGAASTLNQALIGTTAIRVLLNSHTNGVFSLTFSQARR
jgi:hypothetical protein